MKKETQSNTIREPSTSFYWRLYERWFKSKLFDQFSYYFNQNRHFMSTYLWNYDVFYVLVFIQVILSLKHFAMRLESFSCHISVYWICIKSEKSYPSCTGRCRSHNMLLYHNFFAICKSSKFSSNRMVYMNLKLMSMFPVV